MPSWANPPLGDGPQDATDPPFPSWLPCLFLRHSSPRHTQKAKPFSHKYLYHALLHDEKTSTFLINVSYYLKQKKGNKRQGKTRQGKAREHNRSGQDDSMFSSKLPRCQQNLTQLSQQAAPWSNSRLPSMLMLWPRQGNRTPGFYPSDRETRLRTHYSPNKALSFRCLLTVLSLTMRPRMIPHQVSQLFPPTCSFQPLS